MLDYEPNQFFQTFQEPYEILFSKQLQPLNSLGCNYFYFLVSDKNKQNQSYRFCTHADWLDYYHYEKLIENDPLKRMSNRLHSGLIPWNQVCHINSKEKRTMEGRKDFGLYNGLSISKNFQDKKYIFVLATEYKDHDLARFLLLEKGKHLEVFMNNCMGIYNHFKLKN